ncbi:MAG: hypothetical protein ABJH68_02800 [Ilumatobacter sp.]|uniref:hypothetical protein n=1 Tax=Ilumatobacter sp. TaxID=1967498 RepID=UPI00329A6475
MTLLAHAGAGLINTWGFAYVGGIIGLFSVSLLYVKGKVTEGSSIAGRPSRRSGLAVLGPGVIVVGGVCGVSFGLGAGSLLERQFFDDVEVSSVVERLCETSYDPAVAELSLHDDIGHVADDLDAATAQGVHRELHARNLQAEERNLLVDRLISELTAADGNQIASCEAFSVSRTGDQA